MSAENQKIIDKIQKLLRLAKDGEDSDESQNAFVFAQKLMIKYKIDKMDLESDILTEDMIGEESITVYKKLYWWEKILSTIIADNFRVKTYIHAQKIPGNAHAKRKIIFFGHGEDLELAKEMYILAYDAVQSSTAIYMRDYRLRSIFSSTPEKDVRKSYCLGFLNGLREKFNQQISQLKGKYEIAVQVPQDVEDAFADKSKGWGSTPIQLNGAFDNDDYRTGYHDGNSVDLTRTTLDV